MENYEPKRSKNFLNFTKKSLKIIAGILIDHCSLNIKIFTTPEQFTITECGGTLKAVRKEHNICFESNMQRNHILGDMRYSSGIRIIR